MQSELQEANAAGSANPITISEAGTGERLAPLFADVLNDVEVELTVCLGTGSLTVKNLLSLKSGATVILDMPLNGLVDVYLKEALIGRGEIVAVDDHYGIRLTEVAEIEL